MISPQSCTATAYGYYTEPNTGILTDVRCTKTGANCVEAIAAAESCRNQNVCKKVIENGLIPDASLGCKVDSFVLP